MAVSCNFDPSKGIKPGHCESSLKDTELLVCASDTGPPTSEGLEQTRPSLAGQV
jgi:hypothetical protein